MLKVLYHLPTVTYNVPGVNVFYLFAHNDLAQLAAIQSAAKRNGVLRGQLQRIVRRLYRQTILFDHHAASL